jgi:hypothetical protein
MNADQSFIGSIEADPDASSNVRSFAPGYCYRPLANSASTSPSATAASGTAVTRFDSA